MMDAEVASERCSTRWIAVFTLPRWCGNGDESVVVVCVVLVWLGGSVAVLSRLEIVLKDISFYLYDHYHRSEMISRLLKTACY